jgi:DNA-binding response OmpR family regulator
MKHRVLLVDDSRTSRLALSQALRRLGYDVVSVGDLEELDGALLRARADLLLVDVQMPEVYGTDLVPWLRESRRVDRPILLYSNRAPEELAALAEECGADGFIRKTGRADEVAAHVERYLEGAGTDPAHH